MLNFPVAGGSAHRLRRAPLRFAVVLLVGAVTMSGCITGERPRLVEGTASTGDAAIDAVLAELDDVSDSRFTATYTILNRFGSIERPATVVQASPSRRSITIGVVRFIIDGDQTASCDFARGRRCSEVISAEMISDMQLTPDFYGSSTANRLRRDAERTTGPTQASTQTIVGREATCVDVPVPGGTVTYCALDSGVLARLEGADVAIELTEYSDRPDERYFRRRP